MNQQIPTLVAIVTLLVGVVALLGWYTAAFNLVLSLGLLATVSTGSIWWIARILTGLDSRRRAAEEGLRQANLNLETRVAEQTRALAAANQHLNRQLQEQQHLLEKLNLQNRAIASSHLGIVISDPRQPDNPIIYVNSAFEGITGYTPAEVLGRNCRFLQGSDTHQPNLSILRAALQLGQNCKVVLRNYRKDGTLFWNELSVTPVYNEQDQLSYFVGIQDDISERKKIEESLYQSEELFRQITENLRDGLYIYFLESQQYLYRSPAYQKIWDRDLDDLANDAYRFQCVPVEDRMLLEAANAQEEEGKITDIEHRILRPNGEIRWVHNRVFPIKNEQGKPVRLVGILEDITERKKSELTSQKQQDFLRLLIDTCPDLIVVRDPQHHIVLANQTYASFYGKTMSELLNGDELATLPDWLQTQIISENNQVLATGEELISADQPQINAEGESRWLRWIKRAVPRPDGQGFCVLQVGADVTELKQAELRQQQAREAAEEATRAKSEFLATMSHEIRTPMNAVVGMTGLLLDTSLTEQQRSFVETIRSGGDALLQVINHILDFSKIESDRLELEEHPFKIRECVEEVLDLLAGEAAEKQLELLSFVDPQVPETVVGDVSRLKQVFVNLVGNAIKFTDQGEVVVTLSARRMDPDHDGYQIQCTVKDTGIGIAPDRLEKLFQPFSQVDGSITRRYGGTGLGLAISRRLCELMGGTLAVESQPGQGSVFTFTVLARSIPTPSLPRPVQLLGKRLLVVDDNATNRQILTLQTQAWGLEVIAFSSGREALDHLAQTELPHLIILDLQMPEMDGLTLAQRIRQEHGTVPILLLTSVDHLGLPSPHIPIDAHLTKPVRHSQLYNTLLSVLQDAAPQQPQPDPFRWDRPMALTHPLRILVAEDNPINQRVALMMLERLGYRADVVGNGLEVLAALQRQPYDVILMDLQMPEMDGLAASRCLRQTGCPPTQPWIIALTAHAFQDARDEAEAAGMNDYLSKPIRMNDLALALQKVTTVAVAGQPPASPLPAEAQTEPALDPETWQSLKAAIGLDSLPLLQEIIDNYLSDSQQRIQTLTTAYQQGNGLLLSRTAHSLLGSSSNLGAVRLTTLCRQVVTLCKTDSLPAALPQILEQIRQESLRVASALQKERSRC